MQEKSETTMRWKRCWQVPLKTNYLILNADDKVFHDTLIGFLTVNCVCFKRAHLHLCLYLISFFLSCFSFFPSSEWHLFHWSWLLSNPLFSRIPILTSRFATSLYFFSSLYSTLSLSLSLSLRFLSLLILYPFPLRERERVCKKDRVLW